MKNLFTFLVLIINMYIASAQTPFLVKDIYIGKLFNHSSDPGNFADLNGTIYFSADSGKGPQLWKSNGTAATTEFVSDVAPSYMKAVGNKLYFISLTNALGREIWTSDGTAAGTQILKDINPGANSSADVRMVTDVNGTVFFSADDGVNGEELWKTDGTTAGTIMVKDIMPGITGSTPKNLTSMNGQLYFMATDSIHGYELWKSDGTAAGTVLVKDINPGLGLGYAVNLYNFNGTLYFEATDGTAGFQLWKSDGTTAGTVMVKNVSPDLAVPFSSMNGKLYFSADDHINGSELWVSDGTAAGTYIIKDLVTGSMGSHPSFLTTVNNTLYFASATGNSGYELSKTDGTGAGTVKVVDIMNGQAGVVMDYFTNINGTFYFAAGLQTYLMRIYTTDGTAAGTTCIDTVLHPRSQIVGSNGIYYFCGNDAQLGNELWAFQPPTPLVPLAPSGLNANPTLKTDQNGKINLQWTDNSNNETGFHIERSNTGSGNWLLVDSVTANTTSYIDANLANVSTFYYRVNAYNTTGNSAYSNTSSATTYSGFNQMHIYQNNAYVYPNPFNEVIYIYYESLDMTPIQISITDISGKLIAQENKQASVGKNIYSLDSNLSNGIYIIHITSAHSKMTIKTIKE